MNDTEKFEKFTERPLDPRELATPAVAHGLVTREVLRMADIATQMFELSVQAFEGPPDPIQTRIEILDDQLDELNARVLAYLIQVDEQEMTWQQSCWDIILFTLIRDLEAIGNVIATSFMALARRRFCSSVQFSEEGWQDLLDYHQEILKELRDVLAAFAAQDSGLITKILSCQAEFKRLKRHLYLRHIRELRADVPHSRASSAVYLELLDAMGNVLARTFNITYALNASISVGTS